MSKDYAKQQKQLIQHRKAIFSLDISIYFSHQQFCLIIMVCAGFRFQNQRQCKISHHQPTYSTMFTDQLQQYINGNINPRSGERLGAGGVGPGKKLHMCVLPSNCFHSYPKHSTAFLPLSSALFPLSLSIILLKSKD